MARWKSCIVELKTELGWKPHSDLVWLCTSSVGLSFLIYKMRGLDSELKVKCSFIWHTGVLLKVFTQKLDYGKRCLVILHFLPKALCAVFSGRLSLLTLHLLHYFALWFCLSLASRWYLQNWELKEIEREVFFFPLLLPALMCWVHKSSFYGAPLLSLPPQTY